MARKAGISRSDVLDAAIEVADADGLGGLTLAAVASRLGIRTPSLYAHIDGIAGLKRLMAVEGAALLGTALEDGAAGAQGADALAAFMRAYRGFAHRNPGLYEASQSDAPHPDDDPAHAAALEGPVRVAARALTEMGIPPDGHIDAIRGVRAALHGWVDLERRGGFGLPDDVEASFNALVELLISGLAAD